MTISNGNETGSAARGLDGRRYSWGNDFDDARCVTGRTHEEGTLDVESYPLGVSPEGVVRLVENVAD